METFFSRLILNYIFITLQKKPKRVRALYDCTADYEDELTFEEGETILVTGEADTEWWVSSIYSFCSVFTTLNHFTLWLVGWLIRSCCNWQLVTEMQCHTLCPIVCYTTSTSNPKTGMFCCDFIILHTHLLLTHLKYAMTSHLILKSGRGCRWQSSARDLYWTYQVSQKKSMV